MDRNSRSRSPREVSVGEFREEFAETLNRVKYGNGRTVVKRHGKKVAAVISIDDLRLLESLEEILDRQAIKEAEADIQAYGRMSWEDALRDLGVEKDDLQSRTESGRRKRSQGRRAKTED